MRVLKMCVLFALLGASALARADVIAIVGARAYTAADAAPIKRATIVIRDGVITAVGDVDDISVPKDAEIIDGSKKVVVAGFWNSHVHLLQEPYRNAARQPAEVLAKALETHFGRWGFTTIFDISSLPGDALALRRRIADGELIGPQILTVDAPFFPEHGTPIYVKDLLTQLQVPSFEVKDAAEARARATQQLSDGADGVKVFAGAIVGGDVGVLPMEVAIARAAIDQAHRVGKYAFAHPTNEAGLQVALDSGVDVLAHTTPTAAPWTKPFARQLAEKNIAVIPTLTLIEIEVTRDGAPAEFLARIMANASQQVKQAQDAGAPLLFGTDAGYIDVYAPLREYQLMAKAGLNWRQILSSLTTQPSARFGQGKRKGRIAVGMDADLVVLTADPARDVDAFAKVDMTIRAGKIIHRSARSQKAD